jgi:hypothetical protein
MDDTRRPRLVATILFALAALACDASPFGGATPYLEGTIVSRGPGTMLVIDSSLIAYTDCRAAVDFWFDTDVIILHNGLPKDTSELTVGRRVSVFQQGAVLKSCPPMTGAVGVIVH